MKSDSTLGPGRRWARDLICLAEQSLSAESEWLADTRARLGAAEEPCLLQLRDVLNGRKSIASLSENQFDLYFGLRLFLASRRAAAPAGGIRPTAPAPTVKGRAATHAAMPRGLRAIARKAEYVFGEWPKAWRWLTSPNARFGGTPWALTSSKRGRRLVYDELVRIDWSDFT